MSWLPSALAVVALVGLLIGASLVLAARRRRALRSSATLPEGELGSSLPRMTNPDELAPPPEPRSWAPVEPPSFAHLPEEPDEHTVIMPSLEAESLALLSVHEKPTREFSAFMEEEEASEANEAPTLPPPPGHAQEHPELMPIDAAALQTMSKALFTAQESEDEADHTSIFQPDAETLDTLRGAAAEVAEPTEPVRERPPASSTQKILREPAAPSAGLPPPGALASERARALIQSERARATSIRSESFYIQSNVNSEERLQLKRVSVPPAPVRNDLRSSGYAPRKAAGTESTPPQGARGKGRG